MFFLPSDFLVGGQKTLHLPFGHNSVLPFNYGTLYHGPLWFCFIYWQKTSYRKNLMNNECRCFHTGTLHGTADKLKSNHAYMLRSGKHGPLPDITTHLDWLLSALTLWLCSFLHWSIRRMSTYLIIWLLPLPHAQTLCYGQSTTSTEVKKHHLGSDQGAHSLLTNPSDFFHCILPVSLL